MSQTSPNGLLGLLPQRRFLVLFLPTWATDYLKRLERDLANGPLVLYERIKGGLRLAAVDAAAARSGLSVGQNLADARAMLPSVMVREIDRSALEAAFADFADWHSNASPLVSVLTDKAAFGDLVLDIGGVEHLFGGEKAMLRTLLTRLRDLGYAVAGAIAPTIGGAWAISHFAQSQVVKPGGLADSLETLSVAALRLDQSQITGLVQMGLKTIGQLVTRDRKALQARFGISLLKRLDQAYGAAEERMTPRLPVVDRYAERRFADPIGMMDDVLMCAHDLAIQLALRLEAEGMGAQEFHLFLYRVDHRVMTMTVNAARLTRDAEHIARLFSYRSERLQGDYDAGFGIDMIRLAASSIGQLDALQLGVFAVRDGAEDLDQLYDRVSSRLGKLAVVKSRFINKHIPEQAVKLEPAIARVTSVPPLLNRDISRPLRLLPLPEPITVLAQVPDGPPNSMIWRRLSYVFSKVSSAYIVSPEWLDADEQLKLMPDDEAEGTKPSPLKLVMEAEEPRPTYQEGMRSRVYYIVEDATGRRFWLFREGMYGIAPNPVWFMHGLFS